jgi:hypothetical protein
MDKVTPQSDGDDCSLDFCMETRHVSLARGAHEVQRLGI